MASKLAECSVVCRASSDTNSDILNIVQNKDENKVNVIRQKFQEHKYILPYREFGINKTNAVCILFFRSVQLDILSGRCAVI